MTEAEIERAHYTLRWRPLIMKVRFAMVVVLAIAAYFLAAPGLWFVAAPLAFNIGMLGRDLAVIRGAQRAVRQLPEARLL